MSLLLQQKRLPIEAHHLLLNVGYRVTAQDFVSASGHKLGDVILQQQQVPLLMQICRTQIRKHLNYFHGGWELFETILHLPLPFKLMEFLLLKDELEAANVSCPSDFRYDIQKYCDRYMFRMTAHPSFYFIN